MINQGKGSREFFINVRLILLQLWRSRRCDKRGNIALVKIKLVRLAE